MTARARTTAERIADTQSLLEREVDCWVASADAETGAPYLVPLSYVWDGLTVLLATSASSPTGRALVASGRTRLAFGATRDVVMLDGTVEVIESRDLSTAEGDRFALRTGFDPRALRSRYLYFRVTPAAIQAWREENELSGRDLMRAGRWLED